MEETQILVVEDEQIVAKDIESSLKFFGYAVSGIVSSGEEAIKKVARLKPDLILVDIKLKGKMDGVEAVTKIHRRFDIPVIYLTSYADEKTLDRAKITRPFGYILKPIEAKELHIIIEIALYRNKMEKELEESKKWLTTILKGITDAVIAANTEGLISFMNPVAEAITGRKQKDAMGKDVTGIFNIKFEETSTDTENPVTKALREGREISLSNHTVLLSKSGREIPIDYGVAPIRNDKRKIIGVAIVFRDITERKRAENELKKKIDDLERFYKVAVGRELKMIELKKKAKELERRMAEMEIKLEKNGHRSIGY